MLWNTAELLIWMSYKACCPVLLSLWWLIGLKLVGEVGLIGLDPLEVRSSRKPWWKFFVLLVTRNLALDANCRSWALRSEWIAGPSFSKKVCVYPLGNVSSKVNYLQVFGPDECGKSNARCYVPYTEQDVFNIHSGDVFEVRLEFMLLLLTVFSVSQFLRPPPC